jgi:hypothetical protein
MKNVSDKVTEKIKTQIFIQQLFFENHYFCDVSWKNIVEFDKPQITLWRMRFAC